MSSTDFANASDFHQEYADVAFAGRRIVIVVQIQLEAVFLVPRETHVHVQAVVGARRADAGVLQALDPGFGYGTGRTLGPIVMAFLQAEHFSQFVGMKMARSPMPFQ